MGDRTTVVLSLLTSQVKEAEELLGYLHQSCNEECMDNTTDFAFEEVNYGDLEGLVALEEAGIAYESTWRAGCEYEAGTTSVRFTSEGEKVKKTIYDSDLSIPITDLMHLINQPEAILELIKNSNEEVQVLPWDNQEEYGKRYRARQLIST